MATYDQYAADKDALTRGRARDMGATLASQAATWFVLAIAGMLTVFVGLGIDAWKHNNGAGEEALLSLSNPGHLVAGIGIIATSLSALAGLTVGLLRDVHDRDSIMRRFAGVTAAWVVLAVAGFASITYIAASDVTVGHSGHDVVAEQTGDGTQNVAADGHDAHEGDEASGVQTALEKEGLNSPDDVEGVLNQGASGHEDGKHDYGPHATFTQLSTLSNEELLGMFPEGTVSAENLPLLKEQVLQVREVALKYPTPESASAAGFFNTTSDVPFMGRHYINAEFLRDGKFDPTKPEGLLYSKIDGGPEKLVGVWFLQIPGIGDVKRDVEPAGFAGDLDLWHAHLGLCLVGTTGASEGETQESCSAKGGRFTADLRWMMHVWVAPEAVENSDGFFAYLNGDLYQMQTAVKEGSGSPSGTIVD